MARETLREPIVITGIGLVASTGRDREAVWNAVRHGRSGVRALRHIPGFAPGELIGATVDGFDSSHGRPKVFGMCERAADEAIRDAGLDLQNIDLGRVGCSISGIIGDGYGMGIQYANLPDSPDRFPWWEQFFPNSLCSWIGNRYQFGGPRLCHSTACASSLVSILSAVQSIRNGQADVALTGGGEAIDPLFAAGFQRMKVLAHADDPTTACRPFDRQRTGFVLGEGAGVLVVERLGHALRRGARIYAEIVAGKMLADAYHVTGLADESDALPTLIQNTLDQAGWEPNEVGYVNVHGTGTQQNDLVEMRGIRRAFGPATEGMCASATKSMLGHMINAAGAVELAITTLAMRDGFAPPTLNLHDPDPECTFDCLPITGRPNRFQNALKLSVAFGGHLVAVALSRWNDSATGFAYPALEKAA